MINALLLSNSTMPGGEFFDWPRRFVQPFFAATADNLIFVPFAAVTISYDDYSSRVKTAFSSIELQIKSIHEFADAKAAISAASGIIVGGGNTFALLARMYESDILDTIRDRVNRGVPYVGWSAGANVACPTIMTTNDMPIIQPPRFAALNLVPFQVNPHYHELKFEGQGGETRKERLEEYVHMNPGVRVVGLPEGTLIRRNDDKLALEGKGTARLYEHGKDVRSIDAGSDISFML